MENHLIYVYALYADVCGISANACEIDVAGLGHWDIRRHDVY